MIKKKLNGLPAEDSTKKTGDYSNNKFINQTTPLNSVKVILHAKPKLKLEEKGPGDTSSRRISSKIQDPEVNGPKKSLTYQRKICALEFLYLRKTIDQACYAAGCKLVKAWEKAHINVYVSSFCQERVDCGTSLASSRKESVTTRQLEGIELFNRLLKNQNERGRKLLIAVCIDSKNFQDIQKETGWQLKYISERFKEAINDLALHCGIKKRERV